MPLSPPEKARWGKDGGPGGKARPFHSEAGKGVLVIPLRAGSDRRRPQAVPVATKEATGIDSRDKGGLPPGKTIYF